MKKVISVILAMVVMVAVFCTSASAATTTISDIKGNEYEAEIKALNKYGALDSLVSSAGKLRPTKKIKQAEFNSMLENLYPGRLTLSGSANTTANQKFACNQMVKASKQLGFGMEWTGQAQEELTRARACHLVYIWLESDSRLKDEIGKKATTTATTPWTGTDAIFKVEDKCSNMEVLYRIWTYEGSPKSSYECPIAGVDSSSKYYTALCWAGEEGLITDDRVNPAAVVANRATAVYYLWTVEGCPPVRNTTIAFTDVPKTASYYTAARWAVARGYISGTSKTTFSPYKDITMGELASLLYYNYEYDY